MVTIAKNLSSDELRAQLVSLTDDTDTDTAPNTVHTNSINLSFNNLHCLSNIFPLRFRSIIVLRLDDCKCSRIKRKTFDTLAHVELISLDRNLLRNLTFERFVHCPHLKYLSAKQNLIENLYDDGEDGNSFERLQHLRKLDLSFNLLKNFDAFKNRSLNVLYLNNNRIESFMRNMLPALTELNMAFNRLKKLGNGMFDNLMLLDTLNMNNNKISKINLRSFSCCTRLTSLSVSNNQLRSANMMRSLNLRSLRHFNADFNKRDFSVTFSESTSSSLESLSMANNYNLKVLHFEVLRNVRRLALQNCSFESDRWPAFDTLIALEYLDLSSNFNVPIVNHCFAALVRLKFVLLDRTTSRNFETCTEALFGETNVLRRFSIVSCGLNNEIEPVLRFLKQLTYLDLSSNQITRLPSKVFCQFTMLQYLYLKSNRIETLDPTVFGCLMMLKILDLRQNLIRVLDRNFFDCVPSLAIKLLDPEIQYR